jgi:ATP-dependent exoDNAse (exonuclease V) alpha subunit
METPIIDVGIEKITFEEVAKELDHFFKDIISIGSVKIDGKFSDLSITDIKEKKLTKTQGMILVHSQPAGSSLRKATVDLIQNGEINNLLHVENALTNFNQKSVENMIDNDLEIARVCPTDASQEKAILASLQGHSIIIGPPGTGKSQTIANLLTNILHQDKTALFISQKRIALEVVIERMGGLKYFMLQLIENQNLVGKNEQSNFYQRLQKFINYAKDETTTHYLYAPLNPLIDPRTKEY